jgi:single-strand DNA-binding protein
MASYNKVILVGNLTRDPEKRFTPGGTSVTEFGLAVNRVYKTQSGEKREDTCFVDIVAWGRTGELCEQYLRKGRPVLLDGRLEYSSWDGPDGRKRSKLRVVAENVQFLGGPSDGSRGGNDAPVAARRPAAAPVAARDAAPPEASDSAPPEDDYNLDDIPF